MNKRKARRLAFMLGRPFAPVYSALMRKRAAWYRSGIMESVKLQVPIISIGNLSMGGTGKTPMVINVARRLREAGYKPAIVSRGYGGKAKEVVNIVSDGKDLLLDAEMAGDEPRIAETVTSTAASPASAAVSSCLLSMRFRSEFVATLAEETV